MFLMECVTGERGFRRPGFFFQSSQSKFGKPLLVVEVRHSWMYALAFAICERGEIESWHLLETVNAGLEECTCRQEFVAHTLLLTSKPGQDPIPKWWTAVVISSKRCESSHHMSPRFIASFLMTSICSFQWRTTTAIPSLPFLHCHSPQSLA